MIKKSLLNKLILRKIEIKFINYQNKIINNLKSPLFDYRQVWLFFANFLEINNFKIAWGKKIMNKAIEIIK